MSNAASLSRHLGSLFEGGSASGLSDRQLLERFTAHGGPPDEDAFAAIVARHGPMVLGVCRQLLGDHHLAEDAFQATFLVLARRARSIRDPDRLATWLYGVAVRTATRARARLARRRRTDEDGAARRPEAHPDPPAEQVLLDREQAEALHREIDRLPGPFRTPVILCYFEGLTLDEAARRLRWPVGTTRSRLARAREKLRRGLLRRGVALSGTALTAALKPRGAEASVSPVLCDATTRAAIAFAARHAAEGSSAALLAREVLRSMLIHRSRFAALTALLLGAVGAGACALGALAGPREGEPPGEPRAQATQTVPRPPDPTRPAPGRMFVVGRVLSPDGKPVPGATVMAYAAVKQPGRAFDYEGMAPAPIGRVDSDGSGRFRLDATRTTSARHRMVGAIAMAPGFGAGWIELDPDADEPPAEIRLKPEQPIQGRLFDLNGRPVAGARVEVHSMGRPTPQVIGSFVLESLDGPNFWWGHARSRPGWPGPVTSDDEGRFTLRGIGRGLRVTLGVDDPRFARLQTKLDTDDTPGPKSVTITLEPARVITGRVTDAETRQPIPHAWIEILAQRGGVSTANVFRADEQGRFRANPLAADRYHIAASAPPGQIYLNADASLDWPKGSLEHRVDLALRRGVVIRGRVTEEGTDRPVAGARISFSSRQSTQGAFRAGNGSEVSAADGSFRLAAVPGAGHLVVLGPSDDYVYRAISRGTLFERQPGGARIYAHAFLVLDPKAGAEGPEVTVRLRRGGTVRGRVLGPDDRPIPSAAMIGSPFLTPSAAPWLTWRYDHRNAPRVRDGRFEIHGLDPDAEVPIHFFEPKDGLGVTARLSGKSGADGPITVRLQPCGAARARLVDRDGKPVAKYPGRLLLSLIVTPGAARPARGRPDQLIAVGTAFAAVDTDRYGPDLVSDPDGRIVLPALIPGATYNIIVRGRNGGVAVQKEFTVKPGETIDLGEILIEKPPT